MNKLIITVFLFLASSFAEIGLPLLKRDNYAKYSYRKEKKKSKNKKYVKDKQKKKRSAKELRQMELNRKFISACSKYSPPCDYIIKLLLEGANVNTKDAYGYTGLHYSAYNNCPELAEILLSHPGIDVNPRNNNAETPLDISVRYNNRSVTNILLKDKRTKV